MGYADIPCRTVPHRTWCTYVGAGPHRAGCAYAGTVPHRTGCAYAGAVPHRTGCTYAGCATDSGHGIYPQQKKLVKNTLCKI